MYWMVDLHPYHDSTGVGGWPPDPARFAHTQLARRNLLTRLTVFIRDRRWETDRPSVSGQARPPETDDRTVTNGSRGGQNLSLAAPPNLDEAVAVATAVTASSLLSAEAVKGSPSS